jgi:hypothetical protein
MLLSWGNEVADIYSRYNNFPPPYSARGAAAPGSARGGPAANAGAGGARTPGATQLSYLDEDGADDASDEDEEREESTEDEGAEFDLEDRGEGADNEAGFTAGRDEPCGECQVIFLAQWLIAWQIPQLMSNRQMRMRGKPASCL